MIDPAAGTMAHINGAGDGGWKWHGMCAGPDGKLYCAPYCARTVRLGLFGSVSQAKCSWTCAIHAVSQWKRGGSFSSLASFVWLRAWYSREPAALRRCW